MALNIMKLNDVTDLSVASYLAQQTIQDQLTEEWLLGTDL